MKIKDLQELEVEQIQLLRTRSAQGDNTAAEVLLAHLREVSKSIQAWRREKQQEESR